MPVYQVYHHHPSLSPSHPRSRSRKTVLAQSLTSLHLGITPSCPATAVKVFFHDLASPSNDLFIGGRDPDPDTGPSYIRIRAQVRIGKSEAERTRLLRGMDEAARSVLGDGASTTIETHVVEIDDRATVMTDGEMNV